MNSVVLPAPLGPIERADLALVDREREVGERDDAAELDSHAIDREQRQTRSLPGGRGRYRVSLRGERLPSETEQRVETDREPGVSATFCTASRTPGMNDERS